MSEQVTHGYEVLRDIEALLSTLKDAETGQRGFLLTGDDNYLEPFTAAKGGWLKSYDELKDKIISPDQKRRVEDLKPLIEAKFQEIQQTIDLRKADPQKGQEAALAMVRTGEGKKVMDQIRDRMKDFKDAETVILGQREADAKASALAVYWTVGASTGLALVLVAVLGYLITRSITRPIARLLQGTVVIGGGNLDHRVTVGATDEVGELGRAFNQMTEKRQRVMVGIRDAVGQLTSASSEILATTTEQAAGAQEQAAAVTETVATVDEVTQTSDQANQRAKSLGEAVGRALQVGQSGRQVVEESIAALAKVQEQVEGTARNILALAEQAQAIGDITTLVADVAEQTNLLALNAAIEASRAGEHGRGFAVVAGEVKALADQSKKATAQVRQILGEIQKGTNAAVLSTEEVTKGVASAGRVADQAGQTIRALAETLGEAAQAASQITASAGQQATGMAQIHQAMRNIDEAARQNLAALRQAEQAAQNLNALGARLAGLSNE